MVQECLIEACTSLLIASFHGRTVEVLNAELGIRFGYRKRSH